jgi:hypothetical protein
MAISGALLRSVLQASIKAKPGVDTPDETIDGFPEFNVDVDTIHDPTVEQKLRALAKKIVASHSTPSRIIGFEVHGHADQTLRFPPGASSIPSFYTTENMPLNALHPKTVSAKRAMRGDSLCSGMVGMSS